jgi:hypothetical protein
MQALCLGSLHVTLYINTVDGNMATLIADPLTDPFYYLKHFDFVLSALSNDLEAFLSDSQGQVLSDLMSLPDTSRALFVRLYLRKGNFFRTDKIHYQEIGPLDRALQALVSKGMIKDVTQSRPDLTIRLRTKKELSALGLLKSIPAEIRSREAIDDYLIRATEQMPGADFGIVQLQHRALIDRCQLTFFGNAHQSLADLILTDLGQRSFEHTSLSTTSWRKKSVLDDAALYILFRQFIGAIDEQRKHGLSLGHTPEDLADHLSYLLTCLPGSPEEPLNAQRFHRLVFEGGRLAERLGQTELALAWFDASEHPMNLERKLRILAKRKADSVPHLAKRLLDLTLEASHIKFAERLLNRAAQIAEHTIPLAQYTPQWNELSGFEGPVEHKVIQWLAQEQDIKAVHTENCLLSGLFGVFFWEVIFAPLDGAFFHPYQSAPADLYDQDFYLRREASFESRFDALDGASNRLEVFRRTYQAKAGIQNPFVVWSAIDLPLCEQILNRLAWPALRSLFESMAKNPRQATKGFPDLVVIHEDQIELIEVKGPGDRLQDHQIKWLSELNRVGISSSVMKITR